MTPPAPNEPPPGTPPAPETPPANLWAGADLDDELKAFIGEKSPAQVAKELKSAQALIGKKTIGIPGPDSTPEEQRAFHAARGVPETGDKYDFAESMDEIKKDMPKGWQADPAREQWFRKVALERHLTNKEANDLVRDVFKYEQEKATAQLTQAADFDRQTEDLVAQGWGPQRAQKQQAANTFLHSQGFGEDEVSVIMKMAGANPQARFNIIDTFARMGELLGEGGGPTPPLTDPVAGMSKEQAAVAKQQFLAQGDNQAAYMDSTHPRHGAVTQHMTKLIKIERGIK